MVTMSFDFPRYYPTRTLLRRLQRWLVETTLDTKHDIAQLSRRVTTLENKHTEAAEHPPTEEHLDDYVYPPGQEPY